MTNQKLKINRIDVKFIELRKSKKKAFIPFVMAGDPSLGITEKLIFELIDKGASIIELGVPFSDPLADGPVIQHSSERALKNNVNIQDVLKLVKKIRVKTEIPIVFLIYYNLVYHFGLKKFISEVEKAGVDGLVIPDLPYEESDEIRKLAKKKNISIIHLMAPTSSNKRIKNIIDFSTGFIYYVSLTGTTGTRQSLPKEITVRLKQIKKVTNKPICVGFGISTKEQAKNISKYADGVIIGSAIIKVINRNVGNKDLVERVGKFVTKIMC